MGLHQSGQTNAGDGPRGRLDERERMVSEQLQPRGIRSPDVLRALASVPRERFVQGAEQDHAYDDCALPIAHGQTISQPYIVALMTELSGVAPGMRVLEIGTGSGYQTAVLAALGAQVYTVELFEPLARRAWQVLSELGLRVQGKVGDGYAGWPAAAPFDAILVTAAPLAVPESLKQQLVVGGRLVVPVGPEGDQGLYVVERTHAGFQEQRVASVRFVPLLAS